MGSTINPRARGGASLSGELRASRDDRQQIRRLFNAQPKPKNEAAAAAAVPGSVAWGAATSESLSIVNGGYPAFDGWTFADNTAGLTGTDDPHIFQVPPGVYMAKVYLQINVSPVRQDLWAMCNAFSSSAYVTHEFPLNLAGSGYHFGSYTIGPLPVVSAEGRMSVSFQFPFSAGTPSVDGACSYMLAKIG